MENQNLKAQTERTVLNFFQSKEIQKANKILIVCPDGSVEEKQVIWSASGPDDCYGPDSINR